MSLYLGNTKLKDIYLGRSKISRIYKGGTLIHEGTPTVYPYLLFECTGYATHPNVSTTWSQTGGGQYGWTQVSSSPNVWRLNIYRWAYTQNLGYGLLFLFSTNDSTPIGTIKDSCKLIGSGNMDVALEGFYCQTMDRMFAGCTGLTYIEPIQCTVVQNVGGMFQGCTNVEEGALAQYNWFDTYGTNINNHSSTFTDCGSNTQTGLDELDQIPTGWGGNYVPVSSYMGGVRTRIYSNYDAWNLGNTHSDIFEAPYGMSLFTQVSVSTYAGVSMNRSRIKAINGLGTTKGTYSLYFYPCFAEFSGTGSSSTIKWCYTTTGYNGMLTSSQGNTDMPGTLDYSTYGTFANEYGSYNSSDDVLFLFLVTNVPIAQWGGLSDAYGVLYNSNFRNTDFWYFF